MKIIDISGEIGWDVIPGDIKDSLKSAKGDDLEIHIASPGGFVYDGFEIYNLFRDYKRDNPDAKINIILKGLTASMATYIASSSVADSVIAEDNAVYMIHNPWSFAAGDYREMNTTGNLLEGLAKIIGEVYSKKTGKDIQESRKMMDDETWLFGEEIKEAGFIDDIIKTENGNKDKSSMMVSARLKVDAMLAKIKADESYNDNLMKAAAFIGNVKPTIPEKTPANIAVDNIPAVGGENLEEADMTADELKKENPEAYAEIKQAGRDEEMARVSEILAFKDKEEYKRHPALMAKIDECVKNRSDKNETLASIMAVLANGNIQASIESPESIATGTDTTASSETGATNSATQEA